MIRQYFVSTLCYDKSIRRESAGSPQSDSAKEFDETRKPTMTAGFCAPDLRTNQGALQAAKARAKATADRYRREGVAYAKPFVAHLRDGEGYEVVSIIKKAWEVPGTPHYIDSDGDLYRIVQRQGRSARVDLVYATMIDTGGREFRNLLNCLDEADE